VHRDPRPLVVAGATAVLSCGLLVLAVWRGWLGPDAGQGASFCEAARAGWIVRQPANTLSTIGFVVAGLLIGWQAGGRDETGHPMDRRLATAMACLVVLLGPGSAAMHATQSVAGGALDVLSMYLFAAFAAAYAIMRWRRGGPRTLAVVFVAGVAFCELAGLWHAELPVVMAAGNVAFGLLLIGAAVVEVRVMRRPGVRSPRRYAAVSLATILVAFAIWNLSNAWLCDPHSLVQGHAAWHLLDAVSAYFLYRYYAGEKTLDSAPSGGTK
jgi:hypothetical protein